MGNCQGGFGEVCNNENLVIPMLQIEFRYTKRKDDYR